MRLDKFLAHTGFGSRKDVKRLAWRGRVTVNGEAVKKPERHVDVDKDEVHVDGELIIYTKYVYVMANKPAGIISAVTDPDGERTISDLVADETGLFGLFPVGRLDKDATGLIILTNDGIFSHRATSPKKNVPKIYLVEVQGELTDIDVKAFASRIKIDDGYLCREARLEIINSGAISTAHVTLTEGRFHQVKRMFQAVGKRVISLKRISFAGVTLTDDLPEGSVRALTEDELAIIEPYLSDE